ncbi:hypothetical protein BFW86_21980 [Pseudomonas fluorescens]|nr:hypothetical protein BFW86_21980 [Pseudomonas fluorescens]
MIQNRSHLRVAFLCSLAARRSATQQGGKAVAAGIFKIDGIINVTCHCDFSQATLVMDKGRITITYTADYLASHQLTRVMTSYFECALKLRLEGLNCTTGWKTIDGNHSREIVIKDANIDGFHGHFNIQRCIGSELPDRRRWSQFRHQCPGCLHYDQRLHIQ